MPRRPSPLYVTDGPGARLALGLRRLRDRAIAEHGVAVVLSVKAISEKYKIPQSTIYAALRGRLPSQETLLALVEAWEDPTDALTLRQRQSLRERWLQRRSEAERDLESERRPTRPEATPNRGGRAGPLAGPAWTVRDAAATGNAAIQTFATELMALYAAAGRPPLRTLSDMTAKRQAGRIAPTILSLMLRGRVFYGWGRVRDVVRALDGDQEQWRLRWIEIARTTSLEPSVISHADEVDDGP